MASWHDIQRAFEKMTGEKLYSYFGSWLSRKDIPQLIVEDVELQVESGQLKLNFALLQQDEAFQLRIPVTLYTGSGKSIRFLEVKDVTPPPVPSAILAKASCVPFANALACALASATKN
jgi:aminopeptidase N